MLKFLIGSAVGFGVGWLVFKRLPEAQLVQDARQMWTGMQRAAQELNPSAIPPAPSDQKMQGFGYYRN